MTTPAERARPLPAPPSDRAALRGLHAPWERLCAREVLQLVPWGGDVPLEERPAAEALAALFSSDGAG